MPAPNASHPLRIFWLSSLITILLGGLVFHYASWTGLWLYAILVLLEVTFSFDNAVINSRVLSRMSALWQFLFLTVGIFIAVFVVRFALPIIIVMISANTSFGHVVDLVLNDPEQYSQLLHQSSLTINAFGGGFLLMTGLGYFFDSTKRNHWLKPIERRLSTIAQRWPQAIFGLMLLLIISLFLTIDQEQRSGALVALLLGVLLQAGLKQVTHVFYRQQSRAGLQVGWAAFASFAYLEVLDASFSFDGVVAAFAITSSILLIVSGLGAGAVWVRSMTIYLLRSGTLNKYRYLEHGAHWAILALGVLMLAKLYGLTLPEWLIGSIGLVFITSAVLSSITEKHRRLRQT